MEPFSSSCICCDVPCVRRKEMVNFNVYPNEPCDSLSVCNTTIKKEENEVDIGKSACKISIKEEENEVDIGESACKISIKEEENEVDIGESACKISIKQEESEIDIGKNACKIRIKKEGSEYDIEGEKSVLTSVHLKRELLDLSEKDSFLFKDNHNSSVPKRFKWIPPRSPYNLIQESLYHKPWHLLVATIFLNKTSGKVAIPVFWKFVNKWKTPESLQDATVVQIAALMRPLGLNVKRAIQLKRFTHDFLYKDWHYPRELSGIGQYGDDSYRIFCINEWKDVKPQDSKLKMYIAWLNENYAKLNI